MRNPNPKIIPLIKKTALSMLMKKNPSEIGMRDIAAKCKITATTIYHYYKDKDELFQAISLDCIRNLNTLITEAAQKGSGPKENVLLAIRAFRDWCFKNPRLSILVMQGIKSAEDKNGSAIEEYYVCNRTGEALLSECVSLGLAVSENVALDVGILISGLWGCIEAVILKKSDSQHWKDGTVFTDHFINTWARAVFTGGKK